MKTENKKKQNDVTPHRRIRRYTLCIENYLHRDFVGIPKRLYLELLKQIMVRGCFSTENSSLKLRVLPPILDQTLSAHFLKITPLKPLS